MDTKLSDNNTLDSVSEDLAKVVQQNKLTIDEISSMAEDQNEFLRFQQKHPENAYSLIMFSLTNKEFSENFAKKLWYQISDHRKSIKQLLGRDAGIAVAALDYLTNIQEILSAPILIEKSKDQYIAEIAVNDLLTGLVTRDIFDFILKKEFSLAKRSNKPISLAMIDIDNFKKVNDEYGHQKGDNVLSDIGETTKRNIRQMDTAARYGGEELVVLMQNTNVDTAYEVAERIRREIEHSNIEKIQVTVSIGIAESSMLADTPEKIVHAADEALYQAKKNGKNQIVKASDKRSLLD